MYIYAVFFFNRSLTLSWVPCCCPRCWKATAPSTLVIKCTVLVIVFPLLCCRETGTSSLSVGRFQMASLFTSWSPLHWKMKSPFIVFGCYCFNKVWLDSKWTSRLCGTTKTNIPDKSMSFCCPWGGLRHLFWLGLDPVKTTKALQSLIVISFSLLPWNTAGPFPPIYCNISGLTRL